MRLNSRQWRLAHGRTNYSDRLLDQKRAEREQQRQQRETLFRQKEQQRGHALDFGEGKG